jgi:hypothetical protein
MEQFNFKKNIVLDFQMVQAYTGSDSIIVPAVGERFTLMGGNISGEFTELASEFFSHENTCHENFFFAHFTFQRLF